MRLLPCGRRTDAEEIIDRPDTPPEVIRATLRDQALVNRVLGGAEATLAHAVPAMMECDRMPVRVLDSACGGADISRALVDEARRHNRPVQVVAMDINEHALAFAREMSQNYPEISFVQGDSLNPPFAAHSFDLVIVSTFLHHLGPADVGKALRAADEVCAGAMVAADLVRSPLAYLGIRLFARLSGFHAVSAHDGAVSVCRAYVPSELIEIARDAGLRGCSVHRHRFYRMALVCRRG